MKSRSCHSSTKKGFMIFFYCDVTAFPQVPLTHPPRPLCFPSRNITENAETHPPPKRDVIIEQPHGNLVVTKMFSKGLVKLERVLIWL